MLSWTPALRVYHNISGYWVFLFFKKRILDHAATTGGEDRDTFPDEPMCAIEEVGNRLPCCRNATA
jgi:hypothetical protein